MAAEAGRPIPKPRRKRPKPIPPPKPPALLYPGVRFRQDYENVGNWKGGDEVESEFLDTGVELRINTAPIESDTEAQLAAEKIVSSLQDGVEALNQVLAQHTSDASVSDSESGDIASDAAETGSQEDTMSEAGFVTAHESVDAPPDSEGTLTIDGKEVVPIAQQLTIKVEQQSMTDQPGENLAENPDVPLVVNNSCRDSYFSVASEAGSGSDIVIIQKECEMTERRINGDRFTGFRGHSAAPSTSPSQGGANVNPNSNRRAVAQVLPTSSGEDNSRKPHRHQTRNGVSSTPTLRRLEDCVPAEYTSSPIVQSLKAAEERPPPPRTLDDLSRSLAAMSTSTSIPTTQSRRSAPTHGMSVSCFQGISPGSISGSSGVSSAGSPSASDTPSHGPPNVRVHEVPARRSNNRPNGAIPRMGISSSISLQSSSNQALSMLERLVRSHPIWFLPHLGRAACNHLLRGLPAGCFIVRASTRPASMALSLRLPLSNHPDCADTDHFLLERIGATVRIEGSPRSFRSLPMLLEHYCKHADDLPCTLTLPMAIMSITSATELQKLALMGQDFWTSDYIRQPLDSRTRLYQSRRQVSQPVISMTKSMATSTNSNSSSNFADKSKRHRSPGSNGAPYTSSLSDQIQAATAMRPMSTSVMAGMGGSLSGSSSASGSIKARQRKALPTASSMLKKSRSEADEFKGKESLSSGTGSVSSKSSSRSTGGSGFLRQIFSSNAQPSTSTNNVANSRFYHATDIDNTHRYAMIGYTPPAPPNSSTGSSLRRSFAKLRGFKSRSKSKESKDDMGCNKLSADAIRARQDAYRRQKTDISFSSVQRLVSHRGSEHSPTRKIYTVSESKLKIIENERQPQMPVPILPKKAAMDSGAMAKCIEELRQKRMAQHGSMSPLPVATAGGKPSEESSTGLNDFEGFIQNNGKPYEVILRNKRSTNPRKGSDRMSVPNLTESQPQSTSTNADTSGYAKFGRSPDTGELQTINEGLITPVVRRKPLPPAPSKDDYTSAEYFAYGARSGGDKRDSTSFPSTSTSNQPQPPPLAKKPLVPSRSVYSNTASNNNSSKVTATPALLNWSEVNSELKSRQRVAKVRPTPQQTPMASSPSTSSPPAKKASEYSQLSDFTESEAADTSIGSFHNNSAPLVPDNDDDAVSVAGTVFNEPWDSNAWENLLDLAKYSDEKPNVRAVAHNFYLNSTTTIEEEDIHSASPVDTDDVVVSCVDSDSDDAMTSQPDADPDQMTLNMATSVDSFGTGRKPAPIDNNRVWAEMSNRIPSEPSSKTSTIDHRKGKSSSLLNVAALGSGPGTLTRRAYTPGGITSDANPRQRSASARPPVNEPGARIQAYVEGLAKDGNTVFGATLRRFIECTIEGEENDPNNVIRNVRQFLNGIKNYLVKHGEGELHAMIEAESGNLTANEFLNIDAILEAVLHKILLVPVKNHLYHLMVKEHSRNGALQTLSENLRRVRGLSSSELGFPAETRMPDAKDLDAVKQCLRRMQNHYSPLKKLENLLRALAIVIVPNKAVNNNNVGDQSPRKVSLLQSGSLSGVLGSKKLPPAEELIRWLVYILAKTSSLNCEVEAWYMWELLPQQLLTTGDAAYYLTTLFSAVHVLKHPESIRRLGRGFPLTDEHADAFVNVAIPDEQSGSIEYHTFPAVPQMNAAKLCRVIAHQFAITNPEDYGLYILVDGYETCLLPAECPDAIRDQLLENGKPHLFAFKRHEAKIAWPKNVISAAAPASPSPKLSPSASEHAAFQLRPARAVQPSPIHKRRQFPVASRMV